MTIGPLSEDLIGDAVALWEAAGLTRPWNDPVADCRRALLGPDSSVLMAVDGEGLAATAMLGHDGHRGWVYYLAVAPRCRGRGLGAQRTENSPVRAFYAHLGYEPSDVVVLARRLDQ